MNMHTKTTNLTPIDLSQHQNHAPAWYAHLNVLDAIFTTLFAVLFAYGAWRNWPLMDGYERVILLGGAVGIIALGCFWRALWWVFSIAALLALAAVALYAGDLARVETAFWLRYVLASQPAVMWMSVLLVLGTLGYWFALALSRADVVETVHWVASRMVYAGLVFGLLALLVRWHESYLIAPDVGHIPVSNIYEVFILFVLITTAFYLYYEAHYTTYNLGALIMLVVVAAVGFLLWYSVVRGQHEIKPLIPALQSWWMKIHVPANFVGYGTFSIAAMVGFAYIIKYTGTPFAQLPSALQKSMSYSGAIDAATIHARQSKHMALVAWLLGAALFVVPMAFRPNLKVADFLSYWPLYYGVGLFIIGVVLWSRRRLAQRLPDFAVLDDVMYKAIAVGFVFFTLATILGAFWAADAWGKYWSWDPKETWALIVWLNYAAWLHLRLMSGLRGIASALWALVGLLITSFAFLGVNMFLSGLHSYGAL